MACPECGCEEATKESSILYCRKCGLELDDMPLLNSKGKHQVVQVPKVTFSMDPKKELYSLKLGLKHKKLADGWEQHLGFKINSEILQPSHKQKVLSLITEAYKAKKEEFVVAAKRISVSWKPINNRFFVETEKLFSHPWPVMDYRCYITLSARYGYHNSSKNFIILGMNVGRLTNYAIAHELLQIHLRDYFNFYFQEKYAENDADLVKIISVLALLAHEPISRCFPEMRFSPGIFTSEHKELASRVIMHWQRPFNEFMDAALKEAGIKKTRIQ